MRWDSSMFAFMTSFSVTGSLVLAAVAAAIALVAISHSVRVRRTSACVVGGLLSLVVCFGVASPASAQLAPGTATLYDVTETYRVSTLSQVPHRIAKGALAGHAALGTPLCPR